MMTDVLVLRADGTQELVARELPDGYFDAPEPEETPTLAQRLEALESRAAAVEAKVGTVEGKVTAMEKAAVARS